jgi:6-phosphogluconolactonase/glucosamine-6-phosphate isomerase/deaminase
MRVIIREDYESMSLWAATYIKTRIHSFAPTPERPFVLGLPTGSSPLSVYAVMTALAGCAAAELTDTRHTGTSTSCACTRRAR